MKKQMTVVSHIIKVMVNAVSRLLTHIFCELATLQSVSLQTGGCTLDQGWFGRMKNATLYCLDIYLFYFFFADQKRPTESLSLSVVYVGQITNLIARRIQEEVVMPWSLL